ncbi:MAG: extracellular solute-binding protein [Halobellus sp.]|uniref:extracellular solute-binding protein n=1 Tax=Halobellus sp. TaxID=1979212 RepID=UPI0035D401D4
MAEEGARGTRRRFLRAVGVTAAAGLAGCAGNEGGAEGATPTRSATGTTGGDGGSSTTVAILSAGSLQYALETGLKPAVDVPVRIESHGSATVARMVAEGQRDPDIVTVADTALFEGPITPSWYSVFASNAMVLVYNPDTDAGQRIAAASPDEWYEPLAGSDVSVGRTDPDLDPLGYRTLFTLELASRYYDGASNLRERLLERDQIYPETSLLSQFEVGAIDAAFAYRSMAVERGYDYVELPDRIDLSNPVHESEWYETVSYTLPSGQEVRGGFISYGSTIRALSDAALAVFDVHTTGDYLAESGFVQRDRFPTYEGSPPSQARNAVEASTATQASPGADRLLTSGVSELTVLI